jgi:predicted transcriptional regulator
MNSIQTPDTDTLVHLTTDIVVAAIAANKLDGPNDLPDMIEKVFGSLSGLYGVKAAAEPTRPEPAVSIRKSVTPGYIICLEDGKRFKMLKRHLRTTYNMSPDDYRARWGLPADYPMTAPEYAERRRTLAKKIGLGRTGGGRKKA